MPENPTTEALPGAAADVRASDSNGAVSEGEGENVRDVLSRALGKDFPDEQTAIKAVKDTFSYVGKLGQYKKVVETFKEKLGLSDEASVLKRMEEMTNQPAAPAAPAPAPVDASNVKALQAQVEDLTFFGENPDLKPYKPFLDELRTSTGKALTDIVKSESFKAILDKAKAADAAEKSKSVLQSNPRLGTASDKLTQAKEALKQGDHASAKKSAVGAVIEAYGLQ